MADTDADWKKFLDSTEQDDEEVETDKSEDENLDADDEDQEDQADKSKKADDDKDKSEEDDSEEEDESEEEDDSDEEEGDTKKSDSDEKDKSTYTPKLKQFLNDDGSLNPERIEKSYIENSKETVRLNDELKQSKKDYDDLLSAIKGKPEVAKALFGEEKAKELSSGKAQSDPLEDHPLIRDLSAKKIKAQKKEYNDFIADHPEAVTDPEKSEKIGRFLKRHGEIYREENEGEIPTMKNSLEAAYRYYGWELGPSEEQRTAAAAKKAAATRTTPHSRKPAKKSKINEGETFFARKLGVKL